MICNSIAFWPVFFSLLNLKLLISKVSRPGAMFAMFSVLLVLPWFIQRKDLSLMLMN